MSEQEATLRNALSDLGEGEFLRFSDKRAVGKWISTLQKLEDEGVLSMEIVDCDEQSSELRVYRKGQP